MYVVQHFDRGTLILAADSIGYVLLILCELLAILWSLYAKAVYALL